MEVTKEHVEQNWGEFYSRFPLVCGINTYNNELTIYACLQQAVKNFHVVMIFDDGSTDNTFRYINKFIEDHNPRNLHVLSVDHLDPWPDQMLEKDHGYDKGVLMKKTHAKSKNKAHEIIKQNFPQAFYVSLEADVICADNITQRIYERISKWDEPFTDVEFFNVVMAIDTENLRAVSDSEDEWVIPTGLQQRAAYDHPGDWTLACFWNAGETTLGFDPSFPYGACTMPWSRKAQTQKKGQDTDPPFGFHMLSYNNKSDGKYENALTYKISEVDDPAVDFSVLNRVWFPKVFKLDENNNRYLESEECDLL